MIKPRPTQSKKKLLNDDLQGKTTKSDQIWPNLTKFVFDLSLQEFGSALVENSANVITNFPKFTLVWFGQECDRLSQSNNAGLQMHASNVLYVLCTLSALEPKPNHVP